MRFYLILGFVLLFGPSVFADNWPTWRGPHQSGISTETAVPLHWNQDKNTCWKLEIPGVGHSSPIVWESSIFLTTCLIEEEERRLLCVDRQTGAVRWNKLVATSSIETMHRDNTPASATPATDGKRVYTAFCISNEILVTAFDFQGQKLWEVSLGEFESRHGFCTSLILDDNRLLVSGLQDGPNAFIAALAAESGATVWKTKRSKAIRSFSTPHLCDIGDKRAILLSGADQTVAYDAKTGKTLWDLDGPAQKTVSSIVTCEQSGLAFVCGGRDDMLIAVSLHAGTSDQDRVVWRETQGIPYMTSPLASNGLLHILSDEGIYRCYQTQSGELLNELRPVGAVRASMVATPSRIYITEKSGQTTVIANNDRWEVLATNDVGEEVTASPAIAHGDFVLRTQHHLVLIRESAAPARSAARENSEL